MKEEIFIQNLKCDGCAASIEKALKKYPEVNEVSIKFDDASVAIETGKIGQRQKYEAALRKAGYPPVGEANPLVRRAKSYVSCAIGKMGG